MNLAAVLRARYFSSISVASAEVALFFVNSSRSTDLFRSVGRRHGRLLVFTVGFFPFLTFLFAADGVAAVWNALAYVTLIVENFTRLAHFLHGFSSVTRLLVFY